MFCSVVKESTDVYREMDMNHTFCPAETSVPGRSSSARVFSLFFHAHSDRVMHFFMRILTVLCIFFGEPNRYLSYRSFKQQQTILVLAEFFFLYING